MCDSSQNFTLRDLYSAWCNHRGTTGNPDVINLIEDMSYKQLYNLSEPRRKDRARTVSGPMIMIDSYQDAAYYHFNYKSAPSTTGLRHHGYVKFKRPVLNSDRHAEDISCVVDCTCPDFKFRWSWADKQRGASRVGPGSMNRAWNRAPIVTNPTARPGLCKHLLAVADYIFGHTVEFNGKKPEADSLNRTLDAMTKYATRRWTNYSGQVATARGRERRAASARAQRRTGVPNGSTEGTPRTSHNSGAVPNINDLLSNPAQHDENDLNGN